MKTTITFLMLFVSATLIAQDNLKTLEKDNFSVNYPENWFSSDQKPQPSVLFLISAPENSQLKDQFRESVNMVIETLPSKTIALEEYTKLSLDQIKSQVPNLEVNSSKNSTLNGLNSRELIWSADFGNGMFLKFKQVFIIIENIAYVITYTATTIDYEEYQKSADKIINSVKFIK